MFTGLRYMQRRYSGRYHLAAALLSTWLDEAYGLNETQGKQKSCQYYYCFLIVEQSKNT